MYVSITAHRLARDVDSLIDDFRKHHALTSARKWGPFSKPPRLPSQSTGATPVTWKGKLADRLPGSLLLFGELRVAAVRHRPKELTAVALGCL